ncbi:MAG: hypothetical protein K9M44_02110 [Candidatus Pacebacteria bacterium]|nr:hypothetical protein [Candidatus Paceibacterota bacterium]
MTNYNPSTISWQIPEHDHYQRSWKWYLVASLVGIALIVYAILTSNYTFIIIIVIAGALLFFTYDKEPSLETFALEEEGILMGRRFYDYDEIKNFAVIYKPQQGIKKLYFVLNNNLKPRLSVPLEEQDPVTVRRFLLDYLDEDLERRHEPISETISKKLKL